MMLDDFSWRHIPALLAATPLLFRGPFHGLAKPKEALLTYGMSPTIANTYEAQIVYYGHTMRTSTLGLLIFAFHLQGNLAAVDMTMAIMGAYWVSPMCSCSGITETVAKSLLLKEVDSKIFQRVVVSYRYAILEALHDGMVYLAETLRPLILTITRSILKKTEPLLDLVSSPDLESIIDVVKDIELKTILDAISVQPLIDSLSKLDLQGLFTAVEPLLTPDPEHGQQNRPGEHLDAVSPLLSPSSVGRLKRLVSNAELLLTRGFVNGMQTIPGGAALGAIKQVDIASPLERARPLLGAFDRIDIDGIMDQIAPLITPEPVKGIRDPAGVTQRAF
ncbi:hypothetical protein DL765_009110 [Monosporascus sp. GIB2]|nr:hypothetical protein DL765_009110 [Monosporascus sp. GIB2]